MPELYGVVNYVSRGGVKRLFLVHPGCCSLHARVRRLGDNGTITRTMYVAEGG